MEIKTNTWHYWLASKIDSFDPKLNDDICSYRLAVIQGFILLILICGFLGFLWYAVSYAVLGLLFSIFYKIWLVDTIGDVILAFMGAVLLVLGFAFLQIWFEKISKNKKKEPGFIKTAYQSLRDKFCVKVTFVDANGEIVGKDE